MEEALLVAVVDVLEMGLVLASNWPVVLCDGRTLVQKSPIRQFPSTLSVLRKFAGMSKFCGS